MAARSMLRNMLRFHAASGFGSSLTRLRQLMGQSPYHATWSRFLSIQPSVHAEESHVEVPEVKKVDPLKHPDYFGVRDLFTMQNLFDARVHMGHKIGTRNEYMKQFIFGNRLGVDILDLEQTTELLRDALNVTAHIAYRQGIVLFVSRHVQTMLEVERAALDCGEFSHCREWKGGTFTNATIQYGLVTRLPDLMIFISTHNTMFDENIAVVEAAKMNIPSIGIVDSSCDPRLITYPVPGNDDTPSAVKLYCRLFKEAVLLGKAKQREDEPQTEEPQEG